LGSLATRYQAVAQRLEGTGAKLVAVSKRHPADAIAACHALGQLDFGENYAQEMHGKQDVLPSNLRWHFIGRIQRNKAKWIAPRAFRVHTLESARQGEALVRHAPQGLDALVAVNIGEEPQKSGVLPSQLPTVLEELAAVEGLRVRGLMCLPPAKEDPEEVAPFFAQMRHLLEQAQRGGHPLDELSMGMSQDLEVALRYDPTWVRVGTAIFGPRPS